MGAVTAARLLAALGLLAGGCSLPGLTSAELFGADAAAPRDASPDRDAAVDGTDAPADGADAAADGVDAAADATDAPPDSSIADATQVPDACPVGSGAVPANLNGTVVDPCSRPIAALVGVTGQGNNLRTCSQAGKGGWQLLGVKPGCHLTLAAYAPGWKAFSADVTILSGNNNPSFVITLEPQTPAPCSAAPPPPSACSCADLPGCQTQ
jgi:hypothetical protein